MVNEEKEVIKTDGKMPSNLLLKIIVIVFFILLIGVGSFFTFFEPRRVSNYFCEAVVHQDTSLCDKIGYKDAETRCNMLIISKNAKLENSTSMCETISDNILKAVCINSINRNLEICEKADNLFQKEQCDNYLKCMHNEINDNQIGIILGSEPKIDYYFNKAWVLRDIKLCDNIPINDDIKFNSADRFVCKAMFGIDECNQR